MKTKRKKYSKNNNKTRKYKNKRSKFRKSIKTPNKIKCSKRQNMKKRKTKKCKINNKRSRMGGGLWDHWHDIVIEEEDPELVFLEDDGEDAADRARRLQEEFNDNFLKNGMIKWKRMQLADQAGIAAYEKAYSKVIDRLSSRDQTESDQEWVIVPATPDHVQNDFMPDPKNYVKYLLNEMPENIKSEAVDGWLSLDSPELRSDINDMLAVVESETEKKYWIDPRIVGDRWLRNFNTTSASDKIIKLEPPI